MEYSGDQHFKMKGDFINTLDIIAKDKAFISDIFRSRYSRQEQIKKVQSLLTPDELDRYNAGMSLVQSLKNIRMPKPESLDLRDIKNMPESSADSIKLWMKINAENIIVYGSVVDWLYAKGTKYAFRPCDIDLAVLQPFKAAQEIEDIIKKTSKAKIKIHKSKRFDDSYKIEVWKDNDWHTVVDIHPMSMYRDKMPYNWEHKRPVIIDGIPFQDLGEQLMLRGLQVLNPGVGIEGRNQIGVKAAGRSWREKDVPRMEAVAKLMIREAREQGKDQLADESNKNLRILMQPSVKPYPQVVPDETKAKSLYNRHSDKHVPIMATLKIR